MLDYTGTLSPQQNSDYHHSLRIQIPFLERNRLSLHLISTKDGIQGEPK
uniref:Uncharacterized protein n=1 Tax=Ascaris lumbricoides TaxID=6252 RepID=A0A0M3HEX2_ASCLU